jgi:fructokinase
MDPALRLGVDLGGTKTEAVIVRLEDEPAPRVLARLRVPTNREAGYAHVVATTAKLVTDVTREAGLSTVPPVGVGMPGSVTYRRADGSRSEVALTKNSNTTCLNGQPFRDDLARALTAHPSGAIAFANDANCFALAEATYGAARGARVTFGVILGTGVGGGIVFRDNAAARVWDGAQGIAGEWGHVTLDPIGGPACYCGRRGCIEQYLSGPAIEARYAARTGSAHENAGAASLPAPGRDLAAIAARIEGDADARATIDEVVAIFGRALATVLNVLDPDAVVLGGGVSNLDALYSQGPAEIAKWIFNDEVRTKIVKHSLGDSAGVIGAALLP